MGLGLTIVPIHKRDHALYQELLKSSNPEKNEQTPLLFTAEAGRGIEADLVPRRRPLYFRVDSEESELFFSAKMACRGPRTARNRGVHHAESSIIRGNKPMQKIRYLEAERASYNYNSHVFCRRGC